MVGPGVQNIAASSGVTGGHSCDSGERLVSMRELDSGLTTGD